MPTARILLEVLGNKSRVVRLLLLTVTKYHAGY
jgi:hypothetical protein